MDFKKYEVLKAEVVTARKPVKPMIGGPFVDPESVEAAKQYVIDLEKYNKEKEEYDKQIKVYQDLLNEKENMFRNDLEKEMGTNDLHKEIRDKLYWKAYDDGHHAGYQGVYEIYNDLMELVDVFIKYMR